MSGGSFDYLCFQEHPNPEQLKRMAGELSGLGAGSAVEATLVAADLPENDPLRDVWRAVEWWRSGDWGVEAVHKALEEWGGRREPTEFEKGWLECLNLYAHSKDGVQYVGSTGRLRRDAGAAFLVGRGFLPERAAELVG